MNMQHYRDVSQRVTPRADLKEEVISMAMEMQIKKRRPVMRRIGIALAAAAVAVGGMTVAVGAANGWDYQSIFTKYFSDKTDSTVDYDFSKVGMDINQSAEYSFGTVAVESALITPYAMYLSWNILLNDSVQTAEDDYLWSIVTLSGANTFMNAQATGRCSDDGAYHFAAVFRSEENAIRAEEMYFSPVGLYQNSADGEKKAVLQNGGEQNTELITFTPDAGAYPVLTKASTAVTLTDFRENECTLDYISVSPLAVILADESVSSDEMLETITSAGTAPVKVSLSAVYADGTIQEVSTDNYSTIYGFADPNAPLGHRFYLLFDKPLETENLTAIVINGTEIPLK